MKYAFFPGCSSEGSAWDLGASTRAVFRALDVEVTDIPDWVCCGSTPAHSTNASLALALPAVNLIKAQEMGLPVMTACAACYARLRTANHRLQEDPLERAKAERLTQKSYDGTVPVHHVMDVLVNRVGLDRIRNKVRRPLRGLKVAAYYGCLLSRPPDIVAFDDPEHPTCMDNILSALGAETVDWPYKTECCGASLSITNTDIVCRLSHKLLSMAAQAGARCITVACPLCQVNLDMRQPEALKAHGPLPALPVPYITQLMGLALGLSADELGLGSLTIPLNPCLEECGVLAALPGETS